MMHLETIAVQTEGRENQTFDLSEETEKSKKYDRQLRLWGDHGQSLLEGGSVCLINATILGTEILKSLILPGIGSFVIVDGAKVNEVDVDSNFFLIKEDIGKSRAERAVQMLLEMNHDVHGDYINESLKDVMENNPNFFHNFSVVIGTALNESDVVLLSSILWELDIPLIVCNSYGFIATARLQVKEHTIIETHPDNQIYDLRLNEPFPSLKKYIDSVNLENITKLSEHMHVPYIIILYKYIEKYKQQYENIPKTYKEKETLKQLIKSGIKCDTSGKPHDEVNFEEALKAVNFAVLPSKIPDEISKILNDSSCTNIDSNSKPFWIMCRALKDFVSKNNGLLPLRGTLPDMTAETKRYIELQQIYYDEANRQANVVYKRVQELLKEINKPSDYVTEHEVKFFCKNSFFLHVQRGSQIADEYLQKYKNNYISSQMEDPDSMMEYYMMLRGIERYRSEYKEYPGELDDHVETDISKLKACVTKLLAEVGCTSLIKDDVLHEFCRYGGAELHTISAFLGGCIAQEVIKLITKQYKPFNNTILYNGIASDVVTFTI